MVLLVAHNCGPQLLAATVDSNLLPTLKLLCFIHSILIKQRDHDVFSFLQYCVIVTFRRPLVFRMYARAHVSFSIS